MKKKNSWLSVDVLSSPHATHPCPPKHWQPHLQGLVRGQPVG